MYDPNIMNTCIEAAKYSSAHKIGGPFGACITKDGKIVTTRSNTVLDSGDPTAHAEMNTIRTASLILHKYDLSDCELYTTGFPCPMCLGAIMWAGIKKVYVSGLLEDAESIGFKDKFIYNTIDNLNNSCYNMNELDIEFHDRDLAQNLYSAYKNQKGTIY